MFFTNIDPSARPLLLDRTARPCFNRDKEGDGMEKLPDHIAAALLPWYEANARPLPWRQDVTPYRV